MFALLGILLMGVGFLIMYVAASTFQDNYGTFSPELDHVRSYAYKTIKVGFIMLLVGGIVFYYAIPAPPL